MKSNYQNIASVESLDELFRLSAVEPIVLFKHSNSCGTSAYVHETMATVPGDVHIVTVQERRDVSNAIADRTGIRHHTPQVFVIKNGEVAYSASHYSISPDEIAKTIASL